MTARIMVSSLLERVVVGDLVGDDAREVVLARERPRVVGRKIGAHLGAAVGREQRLVTDDGFGLERRAAVLMAADAVGARVAGAALEVRIAAPGRSRRLRRIALVVRRDDAHLVVAEDRIGLEVGRAI